MAAIWQDFLVGLIVAGCVIFSVWRLLSPRLRLRLLDFMTPVLEKLSARMLARLRSRTSAQLAGGCGACSQNKTAVHHPKSR
jgi:uncharacterized membrane protein YccC